MELQLLHQKVGTLAFPTTRRAKIMSPPYLRRSSSSTSFHTAPGSPMSFKFDNDVPSDPSYRSAIEITQDVRTHIAIFLDEQIYPSALTLLNDLITAGASCPAPQRPIHAPFPYHIELVSALLIHPKYTNQAPQNEQKELVSQAINFLRNLLAILGPLNSNLVEAFSLENPSSTRRSRSRRRSRHADIDDASSGEDTDNEFDRMHGVIATTGRPRNCAKDFWHMVGWAFNCSVRYPGRWKYWKVWLDYMLDVLGADWNERARVGPEESLTGSLLAKYLSEVGGRSAPLRRIVGSVFTDGSPQDLKDFPEVFVNETKEVKQKKRKRELLDEQSDGEEESASDMTDQTSPDEDIPDLDPWIGGPESIALRQRVLTLLSRMAYTLPDAFVDCKDLYDAIASYAVSLPLPAFSIMFSPSRSSQFIIPVFVSLTQLILTRLLPSRPGARGAENDEVDQPMLEAAFLPHTAITASVADNAKVSILLENLSRILLREGYLVLTPSLDDAVETGIKAREAKVKGDKRKKSSGNKNDSGDMEFLKASGQRLRSLISYMEELESA